MTAAELMYKIQRHRNVKDVVIRSRAIEKSTDEIGSKIRTPVDFFVEDYVWEICATVHNPYRGEDYGITVSNGDLDLVLADMMFQIEVPAYQGGMFE